MDFVLNFFGAIDAGSLPFVVPLEERVRVEDFLRSALAWVNEFRSKAEFKNKITEVDDYIINNLYGRGQKYKMDAFDESIGEMTLLDNLNPDETFTHQIRQIHEQSFAFKELEIMVDEIDD